MSVFTYEKSFLLRIEEFQIIFSDSDGSEPIREQWSDFLEASIEPAGYSAIWRISRASCEDLDLKYPTEVYGVVSETSFSDLQATFSVESVQDENVHLPEVCQVPLEDLYPTVEQENSALNVDLTADCLDRFRFFFNYICLPWDYNDADFVSKHLLPRLKLIFDLKTKQLSKGLSSHIRAMIAEAKYIQSKRENLELSFDDSCEEVDISHGECKDKARKLLELHFRMNKIKHNLDILVNSEMREIYEELKFPHHQLAKDGQQKLFLVSTSAKLSEYLLVMEELKQMIEIDAEIHHLTLHDAIAAASSKSEIYIPAGAHFLNFLEYLNGDVLLRGLSNISMNILDDPQQRHAKISASDSHSMLFAIDGNYRMEHLVIDCENVKTGFLVKHGKLQIKNCVIYGLKESSVTEAFAVSGDAHVFIDSCVIMSFATGISINDSAQVHITNSVIKNCNIGVQLTDDDTSVYMKDSSIMNCDESGILKYSSLSGDIKTQALDWNDKQQTAS